MKRWMLWVMAAFVCLSLALPLTVRAEDRKDYFGMYQATKEAGDEALMAEIRAEMPARLHPAKDSETGLWGYINYLGEWVLPPQYETAGLFRGNYAAVSTGDPWDYTMGIIDRDGNWVVEPRYFVDEGYDEFYYGGLNTGMDQVWNSQEDEAAYWGFFDVRSGYLSQESTGEMIWWSDAELVPVNKYDDETGEDVAVYLRRSTGEEVIRLEGYSVDWLMHESKFHNGFALVFDGEDEPHIINEQGEILDLPDHLVFYDSSFNLHDQRYPFGLLLCYDELSGLYGFWDLNAMAWAVPPYTDPDGLVHFYDWMDQLWGKGYACVRFEDGSYGHIDRWGNRMFGGRLSYMRDGCKYQVTVSKPYRFYGDYAWIEEANVLIDAEGKVALVIPEGWKPKAQEDDEFNDEYDYYVSPGGVIELWHMDPDDPGRMYCALMNMDGEWLLEPYTYHRNWGDTVAVELHRFFSEGLQAVVRNDGIREWRTIHQTRADDYEVPVYDTKVGYINEQGEIVVDFLYDDGGAFLDGLALVARGDETGYIDAFGHEIYFWKD